MKVVSIHQPNYIPWLGYFYKIHQSDCFVFLDDAQYSNEGMHNFHYILTPQGPVRLKIPVQQTLGDKINEVSTKDKLGWKEKHLKLIEINYRKAKYFEEIYLDINNLLFREYASLAEMNSEIIKFISLKLGLNTEFINSSDLNFSSSREEKILDICSALKADVYYSGLGARVYQNEENFVKRGIEIRYTDFKSFQYKQLFAGFDKILSIIDYLMNYGYNWDNVLRHQKNELY